jgi:hypothetical protein
VQINTFGFQKLQTVLTGEALADILMDEAQPSLEQAQSEWPVWTGASRDSIELAVSEVGDHHARVVLQAGGEKLISDPRNKSHKDYAPFIEFNGTKTAPAGILMDAVYGRDTELRSGIHNAVGRLISEALR